VPASFLVIPFSRLMASYGLSNSPWAIVAANVTFATLYAILILRQYAALIPIELDEAARVDGASAAQVFRRVYLPLIAPALTASSSSRRDRSPLIQPRLTTTDFTSVYSAIPSWPPSRPRPDSLKPPNGISCV
jgi:binding-protein-dependent transport system inner membrane component